MLRPGPRIQPKQKEAPLYRITPFVKTRYSIYLLIYLLYGVRSHGLRTSSFCDGKMQGSHPKDLCLVGSIGNPGWTNSSNYNATNDGYMWVNASAVYGELDEFVSASL